MGPTANAAAPTDAAAPVAAIDLEHLARMTLGERGLEVEVLALFDRQAAVLLARMEEFHARGRCRLRAYTEGLGPRHRGLARRRGGRCGGDEGRPL